MPTDDKIEKIEKIDKLSKNSQLDKVAEDPIRQAPDKERFDKIIETQSNTSVAKIDPLDKTDPTRVSLIDEVRDLNAKVNKVSQVTPKDLVAQADGLVNQIETIKQKLASPDLSIHSSTQVLLQNKLSHIDENLRTALAKSGIEYKPSADLHNKAINPIERFLGFLSNGQAQLASMSQEISAMGLNKESISPANMLRVQMKMGYISQELQFFSAVLNKALDSTKTIMNIQV